MENRTPDKDQKAQRVKEQEDERVYVQVRMESFTSLRSVLSQSQSMRVRLISSPPHHESSPFFSVFQLIRSLPSELGFSWKESDSHSSTNQVGNSGRCMRPTFLATGFKFLLMLYLAQKMLPSDVTQLKHWATQNFSIPDDSNAITILFQLEEDRIFNAFGLKQLEQFFESIVRFDLALVIHEFLLGDYSLLCQIPEVANRATSIFHFALHPSTMVGASDSHGTSKYFL